MKRLGVLVGALAVAGTCSAIPLTAPSRATSKRHNGLIAYSVGNGDEDLGYILTIRPNGTGNRVVVRPGKRFPGGAFGPVWSRDGKKLLFAGQLDRQNEWSRSLWYSTAAGKEIRRIPLHLPLPVTLSGYDWAPDGRHVVFAASRGTPAPRGPGPGIYTIGLDGTHRRTLGHGYFPSWSSDGRYIAFELYHYGPRRSTRRIFVVRPNGSGSRRLTHSDDDSEPSFSPDSRSVVFVRHEGSLHGTEWRTVNVGGRHDLLLTTRPVQPGVSYGAPRWAPDGARLAAMRILETTDPSGLYTESYTLITLDRAGGGERVALTVPSFRLLGSSGPRGFSWQPKR